MSSLYDALHKVQGEAPAIQQSGVNPHFGSKYVSLEALMGEILPLLNKHGLVLMQHPTTLETGMPALRSVIVHAESGDEIADVMPLVLDKPTAQSQGSALTYARRYALMSMLGLVADKDDDGHAASKPREQAASNGDDPKATEKQHAKHNAMLGELTDKDPRQEGELSWEDEAKKYVEATFKKKSRSQLTVAEMDKLIEWTKGHLDYAGIPF